VHERERGKESVHAFEEAQSLQHGPPEYLERASCVVDAVVGKEVSHTVGDPGRHFFYQAILPVLSPSARKIVGISIGKEFQDVLAVLLEVAVDLDDDVSGRLAEARFERAGLAVVSIEVEHPNLGVLRRQAIQLISTAVAAAIVNKDDFERPSLRGRV
jgi:anaerobic glycerol-3-phosphate dehydrogenase